MDEYIGIFFVTILISIIVILIIREIVCWYWKINKIVEILERISSQLESQTSDINQDE